VVATRALAAGFAKVGDVPSRRDAALRTGKVELIDAAPIVAPGQVRRDPPIRDRDLLADAPK
jgi:hypothetical protein